MALMVVLTRFYPSYVIHIQLLMILDIASHWIHMYRSVALTLFPLVLTVALQFVPQG